MPRPELGKPYVGMPVLVRERFNHPRNKADWIPAVVVGVGRTWLTIAPKDRPSGRGWRMHMQTQAAKATCGTPASFATPEQAEYDGRFREARAFLDAQYIEIGRGSPWWDTDRTILLADAVRRLIEP